jgi:hypothetical protein
VFATDIGVTAWVISHQHCSKPWGYATAADEEEFHRRYRALMDVVNDIGMFSGYCYTQFADTFQEANGLLCADRTPKLPLEVIAAATRKEPLVLSALHVQTPILAQSTPVEGDPEQALDTLS